VTGTNASEAGTQGLFHLRSELARLHASVTRLNTAFGRRDIASVKALLESTYRRDFEAAVRDRIHTVPLPDGTVLCRVLGRYKMYVDAADTTLAPHLMLEGFWQYWVTAFLCRNLDQGETAYDLDAGYGYFALLLSELVGAEGRVVALEYNPWLFQLLRRNMALNGRDNIVVTHRIVVSSKAAAAKELPVLLAGPSTSTNQAVQFRRGSATSCTAPAMTLDGLEPGSADLVLVSAMALEQGALEGMQGLMDRSPALRIILEFVANRCPSPRETLESLAARFPLRFIDVDGRAKPVTIERILEVGHLSLFLSRNEPH
jgi:FkbM family methyltransferase